MAGRWRVDGRTADQPGASRALKRRGIIAAAGAAVAGIAMNQAAQPVAAATFLTLSNNDDTTNVGTAPTRLFGFSFTGAVLDVIANGTAGIAEVALSAAGNLGAGGLTATGGTGGDGTGATPAPGIVSTGGTNATISGFSGTGADGIITTGGQGKFAGSGITARGGGVNDRSGAGVGGNGVTGIGGVGPTDGAGIFGQSGKGTGVYGVSTNGLYGVRGDAGTAPGAAGLLGVATDVHAVACGAVAVAPASVAGYFNGEVHVEGPFYVDPVSNKHGVIAHPDGTKRVLYSMEAPESWVEDFGKGALTNGSATIALDTDFAAVIHTDAYLVFLTERDGSHGIYVTKQSAGGFEVRTQSGQGDATFYWRVVARPNVGKNVERLPKYTPPSLDIAEIEKSARDAKKEPSEPVKKP